MIGIYLALLVLLASISIALLNYSAKYYVRFEFLAAIAGFLGSVASLMATVAGLLLAFGWFAASYQAQIINREYGTQYTQEEVFYASNVIDTIRMLDRKRIEVNSDLSHPQANQ